MAGQWDDGDEPCGLFLDYGGVLTSPVGASFADFERSIGVPVGRSFELLLQASRDAGDGGMIGALERGEMSADAFDARLSDLLNADGYDVPGSGLLSQLFAGMQPAGGLWDIARQVRRHGLPLGLLSNSWGTHIYPREQLEEHFDVLVISAEVGLRKPDPAIYRLACDRLGLAPERCAFVDDLPHNVEVAREVGMFGVHHDGDEVAVVSALTGFLGVELSLR
jgi:epoxide hydrolase-like predicted phosphatase